MTATRMTIAVASAAILVFSTALADAGSKGKRGGGLGGLSKGISKSVSGLSKGLSGSRSASNNSSRSGTSRRSGTSVDVGVASVGLGSRNRSGVNASVKTPLLNGTSVNASVLNGRSVANVNARTGTLNTQANVGVLNQRGVAQASVSTGLLNTRANVSVLSNNQIANLGVSIGGGSGPGAGNGPGTGTRPPGGVLGSMSDGQIAALKVRCQDILGSPGRYDAQLVALCRILRSI